MKVIPCMTAISRMFPSIVIGSHPESSRHSWLFLFPSSRA